MRCEEIRDLAPEIALGVADGEERAEALQHLSTCAECRRVVEQLSQVADELLVLAPAHEPPAGFESRVVDAIVPEQPARRSRPRWLTPRRLGSRLAPALATAAVTAAALIAVYADDRRTAERYRDTLAQADGQYFQAEQLRDETGARGGVAFGYAGSPSWMFLTIDPSHRDAVTRAELVTREGRTIPLRPLELDQEGSWGGAIPVNLYRVESIRLLGERPGDVLQASFPQGLREGD
jgi:Putative zinc-finger